MGKRKGSLATPRCGMNLPPPRCWTRAKGKGFLAPGKPRECSGSFFSDVSQMEHKTTKTTGGLATDDPTEGPPPGKEAEAHTASAQETQGEAENRDGPGVPQMASDAVVLSVGTGHPWRVSPCRRPWGPLTEFRGPWGGHPVPSCGGHCLHLCFVSGWPPSTGLLARPDSQLRWSIQPHKQDSPGDTGDNGCPRWL